MRNIKFRAWDKNKNRMIYLGFNWTDDCGTIPVNGNWDDMVDSEKIEFMQYTGKKDKQGKEIYEGDIVFGEAEQNRSYEIVEFDDSIDLDMFWRNGVGFDLPEPCEVVGNVYENPEILK